jgi:AcrR family transcriptional regulator
VSSFYRTNVAVAARIFEAQTGVQTRARIMREATALFAERGFQATTIRDIAQKAGVNIAAVNYHFRSKDELYAVVMETALAEWTSEVIGAESQPQNASLEQIVRAIIAALTSPVIERDGNQHLLRLVAWGMLLPSDAKSAGTLRSFPLVVAQLINPFLPDDCKPNDSLILSQWLVGQCLLISPVLRPDGRAAAVDDADLVNRLTQLALGGFKAFCNQDKLHLS